MLINNFIIHLNNRIIVIMEYMQIIDKPKKHKLPFRIHKRIATQQSQSKLPNVYLQSRGNKNRSIRKNKNHLISYIKGSEPSHYRSSIRKGLSTYINFQANQNGHSKFLPEQIIKNLRESVKAVPYNSQKFKFLFKVISQIFGEDFQLNNKDIIAAYGNVTQSNYLFFTASFYVPFSICCKSIIYVRVQGHQLHPLSRYAKKQQQNQIKFVAPSHIITNFICSKCEQSSLVVQCKSSKFCEQSRAIGKQSLQLEAERQKISMSIMVASGRYKKMRIDQISQRDASISNHLTIHNNPEDNNFKKRSQTLFLKYQNSKHLI